jgi:DNA polymerase
MTTTKELKLIDMTIRMLTDPKFIVNEPLLQKALVTEAANKRQSILEVANIVLPEEHLKGLDDDSKVIETKAVLASAPKFVSFLTRVGEEIPMKPSPSNPDKQIPALAKTDQGFIDLTESSNPLVSAAAQARLDVKSTILETRIKTFLEVQSNAGGRMPIALNYYGADTTGRWSGSFKMNQQNLPRVNPKAPKLSDVLRKCLQAPKGYKVVVADLSGIELRVNHFLWQVKSSMDLFIADPDEADLYIDFAKQLYNIKEVSKHQRQVGKVAHLGLGFGAGAKTFQTVAKLMGGVELTEGESKKVVDKWRDKYWDITDGWQTCHSALKCIFNDKGHIYLDRWGLCYTTVEGIQTPVGMIRYPHLRKEYEPVLNDDGTPILNEDGTPALGKGEWWYGEGRNKTRIYAGKITENIVQHLARGVIADMALSFSATPLGKKYNLVHTVHDELIYIVKDEDAKNVLDEVQKIMKNGVTWWPELITSSEGDIAQNYGDAK